MVSNAALQLLIDDIREASASRLAAVEHRLTDLVALYGISPRNMTSPDSSNRPRRQIMLLGAAAFGIVTTLFTGSQIAKLQAQMEHDSELIHTRLEQQATLIAITSAALRLHNRVG